MSETASSPHILTFEGGLGVRPLRDDDFTALSKHMNNWNIFRRLRDRIPWPYTEADAKDWIAFNAQPDSLVRSGPWTAETGSQGPAVPVNYAITLNDEAIGGIGLTFGGDVYFRSAELGYWLSEQHWRKGIMGKVVPAFVKWTWDTFGILIRLNGETSEDNLGSAALLKSAGFELEGRRPNMICKKGELRTALFWGALRPE